MGRLAELLGLPTSHDADNWLSERGIDRNYDFTDFQQAAPPWILSPREKGPRRRHRVIIISDAGPLHYLTLLGHVSLLHRFYGEVLVPVGVLAELTHHADRTSLYPIKTQLVDRTRCPVTDPKFEGLGLGERQALTLAALIPNSFLLCMMVLPGRRQRQRRSIQRSIGDSPRCGGGGHL